MSNAGLAPIAVFDMFARCLTLLSATLVTSLCLFSLGCGKQAGQEIKRQVADQVVEAVVEEVEKKIPVIENEVRNELSGANDQSQRLEAAFQQALDRHGRWNSDRTEWTTRPLFRSLPDSYPNREEIKVPNVLICALHPRLSVTILPLVESQHKQGFIMHFYSACESFTFFTGAHATAEDWNKGPGVWFQQGYEPCFSYRQTGTLCFQDGMHYGMKGRKNRTDDYADGDAAV